MATPQRPGRPASPTVVLFEDHTWRGFNPGCASLPVFEQRCGLFGTRERLELAGAGGALLCRSHLAPLLPAGSWAVNCLPETPGPQLWLSGRLAPSFDLLEVLLEAGGAGSDFQWRDADGLLAACLPPEAAAAALGSWDLWRRGETPVWAGPVPGAASCRTAPHPGTLLEAAGATGEDATAALGARLAAVTAGQAPGLRRTWDLVPATAAALAADLAAGIGAGGWRRRPFGLFSETGQSAPWHDPSRPGRQDPRELPAGVWLQGDDLWCGTGVQVAPGAVLDTRRGPVIIDNGCDIGPHTLLEGPLYLGPGCRVKAGARLYGESSFGIGNRLAGEIGESTFGDYANKQHEGFIGHAVLGSWVNLGAMTTCSDLKNNYSRVRADLGLGTEDTGQRFVGLLAGDHVKTAIGTLFNTGTCVGFASNIFGSGMPPKHVPAFSWGGQAGAPLYGLEQAVATAAIVHGRRGCRFLPAHANLFAAVAGA